MRQYLDNWRIAYLGHTKAKNLTLTTPKQIINSGIDIINASVPGNFELDLIAAGVLPSDIYCGTNIMQVRKYEGTHVWYFTEFEKATGAAELIFEGIDTASEIYIDGTILGKTDNMLIHHKFDISGLCEGTHTIVVHIIPTLIYSRTVSDSSAYYAKRYGAPHIRKAAYMFGWDIMPRTVSAGLYRPTFIEYRAEHYIEDVTVGTVYIKDNVAKLTVFSRIETDAEDLTDYTLHFSGECKGSRFEFKKVMYCEVFSHTFKLKDPVLWWPKNYGDPDMYTITATLYYKGEVCDTETIRVGIRTITLDRTDEAGDDGKFRFIINGKPVFVMGTNWVPTDAFPSRHKDYDLRALRLADNIGCNMIRMWGGNVYPEDAVYDYCDSHGIMVWQDFSMACAVYPQTQSFCAALEKEAEAVIKRLRNHPSLVIWAGDNECDDAAAPPYTTGIHDPESNILTRRVLRDAVMRCDGFRPYLPSSPYLSAPRAVCRPAEDHLWGPRDYFKGDYYKNAVCHFASEVGYHGCPSPSSIKKFITPEHIARLGDSKRCDDPEWLVHAACRELYADATDAYRNPLMVSQVERLFGVASTDLDTFALQSQISQAEAMKYFVERFRIRKWYCSGIIWWNIIDGWPQVSDAVVDWYGTKKLAYAYIKRSQSPFVIMCDEPDVSGSISLVASNDTRTDVNVSYTVTDLLNNKTVASGRCTVGSDTAIRIDTFTEQNAFYRIEWRGDRSGTNHFVGKIGDGLSLDDYKRFMNMMDLTKDLKGFNK